MGTLFDYLDWRGDVSFADLGLNEVDNLIFSLLSYIDFEGIVPPDPGEPPVTLQGAARGYLKLHRGEVPYLGKILPPETITLMAKAAKTRRFAGTKLMAYTNRVDEETQTQFAALTYLPNNGMAYLSFRGTDDTLVGWKENFNMSFMQPVPAQERAVEYVREVVPYMPGAFYLGGHSKGGNLAVYAAVKSEKVLQDRLITAFNNDGPGFDRAFVTGADYLDMRERIRTLVPHSSVVGMLLEHEEDYEVVKSNATGLLQHNGFSWEVLGGAFIHLDTITEESKHLDSALKEWMNTLSAQERAEFVDTFYETLVSTNAKNLTELTAEKIKLVKAWNTLDSKAKSIILKCISLLLKPTSNSMRKKHSTS
ncbi:MAG: DUF2974 domain-containing protein [Clostridia bacterium]|nr:DUF2974 domain-containing protein [Clostridia bacterium]